MTAAQPTSSRPVAPNPATPVEQQPALLNGANIFLRSLVAEGVDTIFGYPGGVILPIYAALPDYPQLKHILTRHEQGAAHMAEGYAKASGKPGVVLVTSGPGATNLVTGLADAYYDSVPVVAFTGNVPSDLLGNDAFQEADILGITRPCTKHNIIVRDINDLAAAIKEAFHVATTGRPGPVLVDIPKDIVNAKTEFNYEQVALDLPGYSTESNAFTDAEINDMLTLLQGAKRPVILSGGGVVSGGAHQEMLAFAERFNIPVGCSLMGLGGFPVSHRLFMGFTGMHGQFWANKAIAQADVLFVCGNRLGDRQTGKTDRFARNAKIVHIDLDPSSLQRNVAAFLPLQGCIKHVLKRALELSDKQMAKHAESLGTRTAWFETIEGFKTRRKERVVNEYEAPYITPQFAIERLFASLPKDSFVCTEVGQHQMWAAQRFNLDQPRSFITSGGLGTMGFGFPAALGVQAAFPDRLVVDIAGDGSFQMTLQELAVASQYKLPVKICVINNSRLGMIRQWQDKMFGRESEAAMWSPDYVKLAEAYGCHGVRIEDPKALDAQLAEAMAMDVPVIIDIAVAEKSDVYPWVPAGGANEDMLTDPAEASND